MWRVAVQVNGGLLRPRKLEAFGTQRAIEIIVGGRVTAEGLWSLKYKEW